MFSWDNAYPASSITLSQCIPTRLIHFRTGIWDRLLNPKVLALWFDNKEANTLHILVQKGLYINNLAETKLLFDDRFTAGALVAISGMADTLSSRLYNVLPEDYGGAPD